jgi:biopolymer transport protein ExbD
MAKIKMSKNAASIDMTAMCDVAFLLLTFFILTATAKTPEALPVSTPASTVEVKLPETGLVMLTVGKSEGKNMVFFGMKDRDIRVKTLELMGAILFDRGIWCASCSFEIYNQNEKCR